MALSSRKFHWDLYQQMKKKAFDFEASKSKELIAYQKSFNRLGLKKSKSSSMEELLSSIEKAHFVYLGDFHTYSQNARNLLRLLRSPELQQRKITLGLEFVNSKHQIFLDQYLRHEITEKEFLTSINYLKSWNFPWSSYCDILTYCKKYKIKVLALNSNAPSSKREIHAANILVDSHRRDPQDLTFVFFGELHLLENKLPSKVSEVLKSNNLEHKRYVIVHQNLDNLYWKKNPKIAPVYKLGAHEYSMQTAPPWTKYESMAYWYEGLAEDHQFAYHEFMREKGLQYLCTGPSESFSTLFKKLTLLLDLENQIDPLEYEDFNLISADQLDFHLKVIPQELQNDLNQLMSRLSTLGEIFRLPGTSNYYYTNHSLNRLAYAVGLHLAQAINPQVPSIEILWPIKHKDNLQLFSLFFPSLLMAYICALIINPYRKCDLFHDLLKKSHDQKTPKQERKICHFACLMIEEVFNKLPRHHHQNIEKALNSLTLVDTYLVAKKVAHLTGHGLYHHYFSDGEDGPSALGELLKNHAPYWGETSYLMALGIGHTKLNHFSKKRF